MINAVKELRQINIHGKTTSRFDNADYLLHGLLPISMWSEPKAIILEGWVENRRKDLSNRLLDHTINDSWDP